MVVITIKRAELHAILVSETHLAAVVASGRPVDDVAQSQGVVRLGTLHLEFVDS